jgi:hypothetical protein
LRTHYPQYDACPQVSRYTTVNHDILFLTHIGTCTSTPNGVTAICVFSVYLKVTSILNPTKKINTDVRGKKTNQIQRRLCNQSTIRSSTQQVHPRNQNKSSNHHVKEAECNPSHPNPTQAARTHVVLGLGRISSQ